MKEYFIGTDVGTSSTKTVLIDSHAAVLSEDSQEYGLISRHASWAEQDPDVWEEAVYKTIRSVISSSGVEPEKIGGVYISALFAGSGVPLDAEHRVVRPAIIWMDRRADEEARFVERTIGTDRIFRVSGNRNDAYFGYAKMLWIRNNEPDLWKRIHIFLPSNSYLVLKLTGKISIDYTAAANIGGIYNLSQHCWDEEMMERMRIPKTMMPSDFYLPTDIVGGVTSEAAERTGLPLSVPVCAGGTDCLSSTLAAGAMDPGDQVAVIGTSINWGILHESFPRNDVCVSMPYLLNTKKLTYTYGGASTAGAITKWLKEEILRFAEDEHGNPVPVSFEQLEASAGSLAPGSDGLIVLPYFMGERTPIWDPDAKGTIFGLTLRHTRAHLYRAILESVAYALRDIIESSGILVSDNTDIIISGGAANSPLWMKIFADVTGRAVTATQQGIQAPYANAVIAGVKSGVFPDFRVIRKLVQYNAPVKPDQEHHVVYTRYFEQYRKLYRSVKGNMQELKSLESILYSTTAVAADTPVETE